MIPFTIFELAVGYTCPSYILPVALCIAAKLIGETICFFIGRYLSPALKPQLNEFRFFTAVETLT
jgi:membrane protein DedA with SNARE-associated domain